MPAAPTPLPNSEAHNRSLLTQSLIQSGLNESGRGMELSDLCWFDHHLLAFDDRTGTLFALQSALPIPYLVLTESPQSVKGMKIEWASVKDGTLYVGSIGKPWTTRDGEYIHDYPQHVWTMSRDKSAAYVDWKHVYDTVKKAAGIGGEGYCRARLHPSCFSLCYLAHTLNSTSIILCSHTSPFIHSFIHPSIHPFIPQFTHLLSTSLNLPSIYQFVTSSVCLSFEQYTHLPYAHMHDLNIVSTCGGTNRLSFLARRFATHSRSSINTIDLHAAFHPLHAECVVTPLPQQIRHPRGGAVPPDTKAVVFPATQGVSQTRCHRPPLHRFAASRCSVPFLSSYT